MFRRKKKGFRSKRKRTLGKRKKRTRRTFRRRKMNPRTALPGNSRIVKMKWVSGLSLDPTTSGFASQVYRCNDILDPDGLAGSHQPMGYNQWNNFYNTWTVVGAKIKLSGAIFQTTAASNGLYGILLQNDATPVATSPHTLVEQGKCPWRIIQTITNGNVPRTLTQRYSMRKWRGYATIRDNLTPENSGVFASSGVTAAGPTFLTHFVVWASSMDQLGSDPPAFKFMVSIEYMVLLTDPVEMAAS